MSAVVRVLAIGASALAAVVPAAAAPRTQPPVIHEPFTALPCPLHPDTTIDVVGCEEHRVLRTDRAIDGVVALIVRLLPTDAARASFVDGERSWLRYRTHSCAAEAARVAGGSSAPVARLACTLRRNTSHLGDLKAMRAALTRA